MATKYWGGKIHENTNRSKYSDVVRKFIINKRFFKALKVPEIQWLKFLDKPVTAIVVILGKIVKNTDGTRKTHPQFAVWLILDLMQKKEARKYF